MKKDKLIKMLQDIPGNPDVLIWNGFVGDFMDVKDISQSHLVKLTFEMYVAGCEMDEKRQRKEVSFKFSEEEIEELKESYNKYVQWEINNYVTEQQIKDKIWLKKIIYSINAKPSGKKTWDRLGGIEY